MDAVGFPTHYLILPGLLPRGKAAPTAATTHSAAGPLAFPLGGRWAGEAGSDEGAISYPTRRENR